MQRTISPAGLRFIESWEALRLYAYPDPASDLARSSQSVRSRWGMEPAQKVIADLPEPVQSLDGAPWTIGYGHTGGVRMNYAISEPEADKLLRDDVAPIEVAVNATDVEMTQSQFDALCSACLNLGTGVLAPQRSLGQALRSIGDLSVPQALAIYDHSGGHKIPGLMLRRTAEGRLWSTGAYHA